MGLVEYKSFSFFNLSLVLFNFMTESMKLKQNFGLGNHFTVCGFFVSFSKWITPKANLYVYKYLSL
jgi:hypothetical protein